MTSALLNGDSFDSVYEVLDDIYDLPRKVFFEAVQNVTNMPTVDYDGKGLAKLSIDLVEARHITCYGDCSASQLVTAIGEAHMMNKLQEK